MDALDDCARRPTPGLPTLPPARGVPALALRAGVPPCDAGWLAFLGSIGLSVLRPTAWSSQAPPPSRRARRRPSSRTSYVPSPLYRTTSPRRSFAPSAPAVALAPTLSPAANAGLPCRSALLPPCAGVPSSAHLVRAVGVARGDRARRSCSRPPPSPRAATPSPTAGGPRASGLARSRARLRAAVLVPHLVRAVAVDAYNLAVAPHARARASLTLSPTSNTPPRPAAWPARARWWLLPPVRRFLLRWWRARRSHGAVGVTGRRAAAPVGVGRIASR